MGATKLGFIILEITKISNKKKFCDSIFGLASISKQNLVYLRSIHVVPCVLLLLLLNIISTNVIH